MSEEVKTVGFWKLTAVALIILLGLFFVKGKVSGNSVSKDSGYQEVTIDMKNWVYSPSTIKVKADVPVRIYLTDNVGGCFRDLVIPELNRGKYLATSKDYLGVTFEKGTYTFACSMFMGQGKIIAE